jgi:hypothetical protein
MALEDVAALAAAAGASARACALAAAVAEERARGGAVRPPVRERQQVQWIGELRGSIGSERVDALWTRSTPRDLAWAIAEARALITSGALLPPAT